MKKYFIKITSCLIKQLQNVEQKLKKKTSENKLEFYDLAAIDNIEDSDYLDTIKWALDKNNITNIALTGPYGSGKSSIIKSFEKKYENVNDYKFLNISLATFKEDEELKKIDSDLIEKSILQQMFYKVDYNTIPNSRFQRIKTIKYLKIKTFFTCIWLLSTIEFFNPHTLNKFFFEINNFKYMYGFIFVVGVTYFINYLIKKTSSIKLEKLSLQGPEINLTSQDDKNQNISVLNKHLDEIIYFFEETKYNIVVLEDLDRFKKPEIFIKLRELNNLLNYNEQVNKNITFIYAIKDNIFKDKDRTKFFDFLIPVIPIINSSNSYNILKSKFEKAKVYKKMDDSFIRDISYFINDMRFLKNVFNEFIQYKNRLRKEIDLDYNKLFAISIYKNHNPVDFELLHCDEGIIYKTFSSLNISDIIDNLNKHHLYKIEKYENDIKNIEEVEQKNIFELRALYVQYIIKEHRDLSSFYVRNSNQNISIVQITEDKYFENLKNLTSLEYLNKNGHAQRFKKSFVEIEKLVDNSHTYDEKVRYLIEKLEKEDEKLKENIQKIKKDINDIKNLTVKQLIYKFGKDEILNSELIKDEVLSYLVRYGYLDETYHQYISYFHPGSETKNDINFILNIKKDVGSLSYDFKLTKIDKILKQLNDNEFNTISILNYDLLKYLLNNSNEHQYRLKKLFEIIVNNLNDKFDFIDGFIDLDIKTKKFINELASKVPMICFYIYKTSSLDNNKKNKYLELIFNNLNEESILNLNSGDVLTKYISSKSVFLDLVKNIINKKSFLSVIKKLNICFIKLDDFDIDNEYSKFIYENSLYKINFHWVKNILINQDKNELESKNYTLIMNSNHQELKEYVNSNINGYVSSVILNSRIKEINEDEEYLLDLLDSNELTYELKVQLVKKQKTLVNLFTDVQKGLWPNLLMNNKIMPSWENIGYYYTNFDNAIEDICKYLNEKENCEKIIETKFNSKNDTDIKMIQFILLSDNLEFYTYLKIINSLNFKFETFIFNNLTYKKVLALINANVIAVNEANYSLLSKLSDKGKLEDLNIKLLETDIKKVLENSEFLQKGITTNEFKKIIYSNNIDKFKKIEIINQYQIYDYESSENISFVEYVVDLLANNPSQHDGGLLFIFTYSSIDCNKKINFFVTTNRLLSESDITEVLSYLSKEHKDLINLGKKPLKLRKNDINIKLVEKLKKLGYISSYRMKGDEIIIRTYEKTRKVVSK